jgi:DNA gyrase subunit B
MPRLVAEGHLYVAQPPLFMVVNNKKDRRYVQTEDQMNAILIESGLAGGQLQAENVANGSARPTLEEDNDGGHPPTISGDRLHALVDLVNHIENGLRTFGRRNRPIRDFLTLAHPATDPKVDPRAGLLPPFLIERDGHEIPLYTERERDEYREAHGIDTALEADEIAAPAPESSAEAAAPKPVEAVARFREVELHEVKALNKYLARLRDEFGLRADVLLPIEVTGDDPPPRFVLARDGDEHPLLDLRDLGPLVRKIGEKGMKVTRFKGLGEMDAEQLWETTMDPTRRTLMQVRLEDVAAANDLFTTLMGDDVEPRREFIEKHALEVKNLDV